MLDKARIAMRLADIVAAHRNDTDEIGPAMAAAEDVIEVLEQIVAPPVIARCFCGARLELKDAATCAGPEGPVLVVTVQSCPDCTATEKRIEESSRGK